MAKYSIGMLEEELKNKVAADWFAAYDTTRIIGKVDFCVAIPATELNLYEAENALWAEAKAGVRKDIHESFVQLILTVGRARTFDTERPPLFLGAFDAGRELWCYYHAQPHANPNASYYDIRRHFQGMKTTAKGREQMNATSEDERYNAFIAALRAAMKRLAVQIEPKVYEYGFLRR